MLLRTVEPITIQNGRGREVAKAVPLFIKNDFSLIWRNDSTLIAERQYQANMQFIGACQISTLLAG
jgi:hypothetical protein